MHSKIAEGVKMKFALTQINSFQRSATFFKSCWDASVIFGLHLKMQIPMKFKTFQTWWQWPLHLLLHNSLEAEQLWHQHWRREPWQLHLGHLPPHQHCPHHWIHHWWQRIHPTEHSWGDIAKPTAWSYIWHLSSLFGLWWEHSCLWLLDPVQLSPGRVRPWPKHHQLASQNMNTIGETLSPIVIEKSN